MDQKPIRPYFEDAFTKREIEKKLFCKKTSFGHGNMMYYLAVELPEDNTGKADRKIQGGESSCNAADDRNNHNAWIHNVMLPSYVYYL